MKKITKRIMALMLSLVMVLGCIPSFINEASAVPGSGTNHTITIKKLVPGNATSAVEVWDGSSKLSGMITFKADNLEATTLEANKTYEMNFMSMGGIWDPSDTCTFSVDASSNFELPDTIEKAQGAMGSNQYTTMAMLCFRIEVNTLGPKTTPIMTAETGGDDTGLILIGTTAAVYGEDYTVGTLVGDQCINIQTNKNWKIEGEIDTSVITTSNLALNIGDQVAESDMNITIGDIVTNDKIVNITTMGKSNMNIDFDINNPLELNRINISRANDKSTIIKLNQNYPVTLHELIISSNAGETKIEGPGILNVNSNAEGSFPILTMNGLDISNYANVILTNEAPTGGDSPSCGLAIFAGNVTIDDYSELFSSGNSYAIVYAEQGAISDYSIYKGSDSVVEYESKASLDKEVEELETESGITARVKDVTPNAFIKTLYKKAKEIYTEGSITASPLTAGTKVKDINLTLDFGDNVFTENYCYAVFDNSVGPEGKLLNDDDSLEAGKTYQLLVVLAMDDVDNYETVIFNGETLAEEENYLIDSQGKELSAWIELTLEPAPTSGGSSKTYKATDTKNTAEKISGSSKKGSKRTITPIEGKKVGKVTVTDKNGNKINVTMNADGTYSFIQPASDVNVEVTYSNREITLNIGSTEASVDGERETLDVSPVIRNDRTMLPIRFVAENLGAKVEWSEKNPNYVVITRGDTKIEITLGSDKMLVNGKDVKLDSVAFAENDRTYLPVRAISEALNAIVEWHENEPSVVRIYEQQ